MQYFIFRTFLMSFAIFEILFLPSACLRSVSCGRLSSLEKAAWMDALCYAGVIFDELEGENISLKYVEAIDWSSVDWIFGCFAGLYVDGRVSSSCISAFSFQIYGTVGAYMNLNSGYDRLFVLPYV